LSSELKAVRRWFDLGTSERDSALDVLDQYHPHELGRDFLSQNKLIIGGENEDWRVPQQSARLFIGDNERINQENEPNNPSSKQL
jgi:hypothetical protein